jgi:hypothetical protein
MKPMARMRGLGRSALIFLTMTAGLLTVSAPGRADEPVPSPQDQEILIKTSLLTFNDANITGNYDVLHARLAKPFRDGSPSDKLKEAFKGFADNGISIDGIAAAKPVLTEEARIDDRGALLLHGYFDVSPVTRVSFELDYVFENGWKVIKIKVQVGRPDATPQ